MKAKIKIGNSPLLKKAMDMVTDPLFKMAHPKSWRPPAALTNTDQTEYLMQSHILGQDMIQFQNLPPTVMARISMVLVYRARVTLNGLYHIKLGSLDKVVLNPKNADFVTPRIRTVFARGIGPNSPVYWVWNLSVETKKDPVRKPEASMGGIELILTNNGLYRREYRYISPRLGRTDRRQSLALCIFKRIGVNDLEEFFKADPSRFLEMAASLKENLEAVQNMAKRIVSNVGEVVDLIHGVLKRIE